MVRFREKCLRLFDFFTSAFPDYLSWGGDKQSHAFQANSAALTTEITTTQFDLSQEPAGPSWLESINALTRRGRVCGAGRERTKVGNGRVLSWKREWWVLSRRWVARDRGGWHTGVARCREGGQRSSSHTRSVVVHLTYIARPRRYWST